MARGLTILGMVVAVLLLILFSLDLAIKLPFDRANVFMDVAYLICALCLGFVSWSTMRELE